MLSWCYVGNFVFNFREVNYGYGNDSFIGQLKWFGISYHKVIEKLLWLSYHERKHFVCQESTLFTFENLFL